jgi:hypothetical protein
MRRGPDRDRLWVNPMLNARRVSSLSETSPRAYHSNNFATSGPRSGSISILRVVVLFRHGSGRVARRIGHSGGRHSRSPVWPLSGRVCVMKWSINDTIQRAARATCGRRRTRGLPSSAAVEGTREQYLGNVQADVAARIPAESARSSSSFTSRAAIENSRGSLGKARS